MLLTIRHETHYSYERPVRFGPHRLLIRPRDSHAIRIAEAHLAFSPRGDTRWSYDALGNSVCWLTLDGEADHLDIISELVIERFPAPLSALPVMDPQTVTPIVYDPLDRPALLPFIEPIMDPRPGRTDGRAGAGFPPAAQRDHPLPVHLQRALRRGLPATRRHRGHGIGILP
jgi:YD repeat-containing protein